MELKFHREVWSDLESAFNFYEKATPGCGSYFLDQYEEALAKIVRDPSVHRMFYHENRKVNFAKFPFAVVYMLKDGRIVVKAVAALRRKPYFWDDRSEL
ncbi:MAG: hypothetical protein ACQKBV_01530 [Puniceicoccales bacterium]